MREDFNTMSDQDATKLNKDSIRLIWSIAILCVLGILTWTWFHNKKEINNPQTPYTVQQPTQNILTPIPSQNVTEGKDKG